MADRCRFDAATAEAARLLAAQSRAGDGGLGTDIAGARAAIALAERIGAVVDHMNSDAVLRDVEVMRTGRHDVTTPNEARAAGRHAAADRRRPRGRVAGTARAPVRAAADRADRRKAVSGGSSGSVRAATRPSLRATRTCRWSAATPGLAGAARGVARAPRRTARRQDRAVGKSARRARCRSACRRASASRSGRRRISTR